MTLQYGNTNGATTANPLRTTIDAAEQLLTDLRTAATQLQLAIEAEQEAYGRLQDMREMYDGAEAEYIAEEVVRATAKEGPLGGIPVSSDGYKYAMTALKTKLRDDLLSDMWHDLDVCRLQYDQAKSARTQAETEFSACKAAAALKTAILQASAL